MKAIFLDIDGVLNCASTKERLWNGFIGLDKRLVRLFLDWLGQRDYKVILSSTWRSGEGYMQELRDHGIDWIAVTPHVERVLPSGLIAASKRGDEIKVVLDQGGLERYVIFDDMDAGNFLADQRPFLIQTSEVKGLRQKDMDRADAVLNGAAAKVAVNN